MRLTNQEKKEIDEMTVVQIAANFRFFPSNMTTGETGRYMQDVARQKISDQRKNDSPLSIKNQA